MDVLCPVPNPISHVVGGPKPWDSRSAANCRNPVVFESLQREPADVANEQPVRLKPSELEHVMVGVGVGVALRSQRVGSVELVQ